MMSTFDKEHTSYKFGLISEQPPPGSGIRIAYHKFQRGRLSKFYRLILNKLKEGFTKVCMCA